MFSPNISIRPRKRAVIPRPGYGQARSTGERLPSVPATQ